MEHSILKEGYLDVALGITKHDELLHENEFDTKGQSCPTVKLHQVNSTESDPTDSFCVMVIDNFVSPTFKRKWINRLNELSFTSGKGGNGNAFLRNCSTTVEPAPILIGQKLVYGGLVPDLMEMDLLNMAVHLAKEQRRMIESVHGLYKVTWHCNLIHTVVAAIRDAL